MIAFYNQAIRFSLVGFINTTIGLMAIYFAIEVLNATPYIANAIGYVIGFIVSFILNNLWTFRNTNPLLEVLPRYMITLIISYILNLLVLTIAIKNLNTDPFISQLFGVSAYTLTMFLSCKYYVFKRLK